MSVGKKCRGGLEHPAATEAREPLNVLALRKDRQIDLSLLHRFQQTLLPTTAPLGREAEITHQDGSSDRWRKDKWHRLERS
jgi:hypothetical protein